MSTLQSQTHNSKWTTKTNLIQSNDYNSPSVDWSTKFLEVINSGESIRNDGCAHYSTGGPSQRYSVSHDPGACHVDNIYIYIFIYAQL